MNPFPTEKIANIKLLILDVDGVLTDGKLYYSAEGETLKVFHVHDGAGIKQLQKNGITVALISCRHSEAVKQRALELGIAEVYQGQSEKMAAFFELCQKLKLSAHEIAYVGDDTPDLAVMKLVGFSIAVANATAAVKKQADWETTLKGGKGAVREVCDMLLSAQMKAQ